MIHAKHAERFWRKVDRSGGGCWLWTGAKQSDGYGRFKVDRRVAMAHRVAYEICKGEIQPGLVIDHLCRNPQCVNPEHLEAVSSRENTLRGDSPSAVSYRTGTCSRGHIVDGPNGVGRNKKRECRSCAPIYRKRGERSAAKDAGERVPT